ncbi:hypothetical protein BHE74_00048263, partial [Ensete ventricosum]
LVGGKGSRVRLERSAARVVGLRSGGNVSARVSRWFLQEGAEAFIVMVTEHPYLRSLLRLLLTMPSYFVAASVVLAVGHVIGPDVRGRRDMAARSTFVISVESNSFDRQRMLGYGGVLVADPWLQNQFTQVELLRLRSKMEFFYVLIVRLKKFCFHAASFGAWVDISDHKGTY